MKKLLLGLTVLFAICLSISSCSEELIENETVPENDPKTRATYIKHLAVIESLGFSTDGIIEEEENYVVEGDMVIPKSGIELYLSKPQTRQARWGTKVGPNIIKNVTVSTSWLTNKKWKAALLDAMQHWNNIPNCNVHFKQQGAARVTVHMTSTVKGVADAQIPMAGNPGVYIRINPDYNHYNHRQMVYVMVHELGHIIGLGHTDYIANDEKEGNSGNGTSQIAGTPDEELESVMFNAVGRREWGVYSPDGNGGSFTGGDVLAIQNLYGTPDYSITINGPTFLYRGATATYTIVPSDNLQNYTSDFNTTWTLDGGVTEISSSEDQITVQATAQGSFAISALVDYNGKKMIDLLYPIKVMIGGAPSPPLTISADTTSAEYGEVVTFTASRPVPCMSYEWRVDGQIFESTSVTMQFEMLPTAGSSTVVVDCRIIFPGNHPGSWCNPISITIL